MSYLFIIIGLLLSILIQIPINTFIFTKIDRNKYKKWIYYIKWIFLIFIFIKYNIAVRRSFDDINNPFWSQILIGYYFGLFLLFDREDINNITRKLKK